MDGVTLTIAILSCVIAVVSFFRNNAKEGTDSAQKLGALIEKVDQMQRSVSKIEKSSDESVRYIIQSEERFKTLFNRVGAIEERVAKIERN